MLGFFTSGGALAGLKVDVGGPQRYSVFSESHHDRGGHDGRAVKGGREDGLANPRGACSCRRDVPGVGCECLPWESQASGNSPTLLNEADPGSPRQLLPDRSCKRQSPGQLGFTGGKA